MESRAWLMADAPYDVLADIVEITQGKDRDERLTWDLSKVPHHCSYRSLRPEKGKDKTKPDSMVKELDEDYHESGAVIVSTSKPIPAKGTADDKDDNPPHRQAAAYYKEDAVDDADDFVVTMEHPTESSPKPLVIEVSRSKVTIRKRPPAAAAAVIGTSAPRAG